MRSFVCIAHLTRNELEAFGYYVVAENDEFTIYRQGGYGDPMLVLNSDPHLYVEDINDAAHMRAPVTIVIPDKKD